MTQRPRILVLGAGTPHGALAAALAHLNAVAHVEVVDEAAFKEAQARSGDAPCVADPSALAKALDARLSAPELDFPTALARPTGRNTAAWKPQRFDGRRR